MLSEVFLTAVAKIAIGLIGFASLIGVFRQRRDEALSRAEITGLHLIIEHSLAALFLSLGPIVLIGYFGDQKSAVRITSALLSLFLFFEILMVGWRFLKGVRPRRGRALVLTFLPPTLLFCFLEFANALWLHQLAHLQLGLVWLLLASSVQFLHFVFPPILSASNEK